MFETFADFRLVVETVIPVLTEEGELDLTVDPEVRRTLEFDTINLSGYYSLADQPTLLRYSLYIKADGAEEFLESNTGYFTAADAQPAILRGGDLITLRVKYTGAPVVTSGIKFIVSGDRSSVNNSVTLNDYLGKEEVKEDE